jgi:hypothetical protein
MAQAEDDPNADLPLPPGSIAQPGDPGGAYPAPNRRRNFFQRLFGGG